MSPVYTPPAAPPTTPVQRGKRAGSDNRNRPEDDGHRRRSHEHAGEGRIQRVVVPEDQADDLEGRRVTLGMVPDERGQCKPFRTAAHIAAMVPNANVTIPVVASTLSSLRHTVRPRNPSTTRSQTCESQGVRSDHNGSDLENVGQRSPPTARGMQRHRDYEQHGSKDDRDCARSISIHVHSP